MTSFKIKKVLTFKLKIYSKRILSFSSNFNYTFLTGNNHDNIIFSQKIFNLKMYLKRILSFSCNFN